MKKSILKELKEKKVPQFLGTYLAIGFAILQFIDLVLINRYNLSRDIIDIYLMIWILLIPTVVVLTYFGWEWNPVLVKGNLKWPKILVAGNFMVIVVVSFFMLTNTQTYANEASMVEITDEKGEVYKVLVPKLDKVKTVACFQFENLTGDEEQDWWGVAFSQLLLINLEQRPEYYVSSAYHLDRYYDRMDIEAFTIPSTSIQRKIALKNRNDFFTRISYDILDGEYKFTGSLYDAGNGKIIAEIKTKNKNPFAAIDEIKEVIFNNIPNPLKNKESEIDLPVSSLLTNDIETLENYTKGNILFYNNPQALENALSYFYKSVETDKNCSYCHFAIGDKLYGMGKTEESKEAFKKSIKYSESLPKRMQMKLKWVYYSITDNYQIYIKLLEMQRKMFPYEFSAYEQLSDLYKYNHGIDSAKVVIQEAIANGNKERGLLKMYDLQLEKHEFTAAEETLNQFFDEFPDRDLDRLKYADLYERQGKLKQAQDILIEQAALNPFNVQIQTRIILLQFRDLKPKKALQGIDNAIKEASNLTDSLYLYRLKGDFLQKTGQINKSLSVFNKYKDIALRKLPINRVLGVTIYPEINSLLQTGRKKEIQNKIDNYLKYSPERKTIIECRLLTLDLEYGLQLYNSIDGYNECIEYYKQFGEGYVETMEFLNFYYKEDYQKCVQLLKDNENLKDLFDNTIILPKTYAMSGNIEEFNKALESNDLLKLKPGYPRYYYEHAKLLEKYDPRKAQTYLEIALKYWENADADFILKQRAVEFQKQLKTSI